MRSACTLSLFHTIRNNGVGAFAVWLNPTLLKYVWPYVQLRPFLLTLSNRGGNSLQNFQALSNIINLLNVQNLMWVPIEKLILLSFVPQMSPIYCQHLPIFLALQSFASDKSYPAPISKRWY